MGLENSKKHATGSKWGYREGRCDARSSSCSYQIGQKNKHPMVVAGEPAEVIYI